MEDTDIEGGGEDGFGSQGGRKYRPVLANDRAVLEMSSMDPGSSSSSSFPDQPPNLKRINVSTSANGSSDAKEGNSPRQAQANGSQQESKLELFGFDSLVNILGLKSMTGEPVQTPSSPRDRDDISITAGVPKPVGLKLGTMMGVFIPCLQSILGIIYYIRFSWIVGMAGIGEALLLVALCGICTFLTSISLSAIATNGAMKVHTMSKRFIKLAKSPISPPLAFPFNITSSGIVLLDDDGMEMKGPEINNIHCQGQNALFSFEG